MSLNRFIESWYLPYVEEQKRASTYRGYKNIWRRYVQPDGGVALREVRTLEGEQMLKAIARREDLNRTTLGHIKHFLAVCFDTHADRECSIIRIPCMMSKFLRHDPQEKLARTR